MRSCRTSHEIRLKRVYEPPGRQDGMRVLVDRIWPRGLTKADAGVDLWLKDVAPSTALRKWFGHDPARWDAFRRRYAAELDRRPDALAQLRSLAQKRRVTLLYAAKDPAHNHALALKEMLKRTN
jgi:uncharacterized protein YeaO (DUF488 family)